MNPLFLGAAALLGFLFLSKKKTSTIETPAQLTPQTLAEPAGPLLEGPRVLPIAANPTEEKEAINAIDSALKRDWQQAVTQAVASKDAPTMVAVSAQLAQNGMKKESDALLEIVKIEREKAAKETEKLKQELAPEQPVEVVTVEQIEQAEPPPVVIVDPLQQVAKEFAEYLSSTRRYQEDRGKVAAFQEQLSLEPDGLYGKNSALELLRRGIVPPNVFYWPRVNAALAVEEYKEALRLKMQSDPSRKAQYEKAIREAGR